MAEATDSPAASVDAAGKALRVLSVIADFPHGARVSELSKSTGFAISTTHRVLGTLIKEGFVSTDPETRRYHLGLRVFELGQKVSQARGFGSMALPVLEEVVRQTGEAALLGVRVGDETLFVERVQSPEPVQILAAPGTRGPLHCTAMGKVIVAFSDPAERERLVRTLPLVACTPNSITDRPTFTAEIARVAQRGYGTSAEELDIGVNSIAVPVRNGSGALIAAVVSAAPSSRVPAPQLERFLPALNHAAKQLEVLLPPR